MKKREAIRLKVSEPEIATPTLSNPKITLIGLQSRLLRGPWDPGWALVDLERAGRVLERPRVAPPKTPCRPWKHL